MYPAGVSNARDPGAGATDPSVRWLAPIPDLNEPTMVAVLTGWIDAGGAALGSFGVSGTVRRHFVLAAAPRPRWAKQALRPSFRVASVGVPPRSTPSSDIAPAISALMPVMTQ